MTETERLLKENKRYEEALRIIYWKFNPTNPEGWRMREIAYNALYPIKESDNHVEGLQTNQST